MQKEKIFQRMFFTAAAAVSLITVPAVAKAAETGGADASVKAPAIEAGSIEVDGENSVLTVSGVSAKELLVGTSKPKLKKDATGTISIKDWDIYEPKSGSKVEIDLSKLKNTADNYLVLTTNEKENESVSIVKIPVAAKYTKAKYDALTETIQASYGEKASDAKTVVLGAASGENADANIFQYRTAYSDWKSASEIDAEKIKLYQNTGAQLYVRMVAGGASATTDKKVTQEPDEKLIYTGQGGMSATVPVFRAQSLPGKESKITIAAKAKGPSVTANFTNGTVKLPKGSEYRIVYGKEFKGELSTPKKDGNNEYLYTQPSTEKKEYTANDLLISVGVTPSTTTTETAVLEVRKPKSKKAASKWSRVQIQTLEDLKDVTPKTADAATASGKDEPDKPTAEGAKKGYKGGGIGGALEGSDGAKIMEDGKEVFTVKYVEQGKTKKTYSVEVTNKSTTSNYEIYIGTQKTKDTLTQTPSETPTETKSVTKIAAAKSADKAVTRKLSKVKDWSTVWIRRAGDKKTQTWATNWAYLGDIDLPYAATPESTTPTQPTP